MLSGKDTEDDMELAAAPSRSGDPLISAVLPLIRDLAPQQAQAIIDGLQNAVILNREHVGCFMPFNFSPR